MTSRRKLQAVLLGGLLALGTVGHAFAAIPKGQRGYEGQPGNQGGGKGGTSNGLKGYEGQPGNQGGH
jgi:hypothetical protein